jgi:hypothetical protein
MERGRDVRTAVALKSRTVSPTLEVSAISPTVDPTAPLNTMYSGFSSIAFCMLNGCMSCSPLAPCV